MVISLMISLNSLDLSYTPRMGTVMLSFTLSHFLTPPGGGDLADRQSPADIATCLNQRFTFDNSRQQFFTLLYGILDTQDRTFQYVSAGHSLLIYVPAEAPAQISQATGFPIGIMDTPAYENHTLQLQTGDRIYLHSDGIIEVGQGHGHSWGTQDLCASVNGPRSLPLGETLDAIIAETLSRHGDATLPDDVSVLALALK